MNQSATLRKFLGKPLPAAACYAAILLLLLYVIGSSLSDVFSQRAEVAASAAMLEQFEGHHSAARGEAAGIAAPAGSPFLEGATVTVAGAALLQRVRTAVTKLGGSVASSQVELQGTQAKAGFLSVIASCEIDQPGLQQLLYDVEAGMPFLFIEQLVVQTPASSGTPSSSGNGKLRVLLTVSGQWKGGK
jgi:general secretion pathway protein M